MYGIYGVLRKLTLSRIVCAPAIVDGLSGRSVSPAPGAQYNTRVQS